MTVLKNTQKKSKRIPRTIALLPASPRCENDMYYFGSFCLNQSEKQLLRHGEPVRLAPKAFDLLVVLIENQGCLVTKERLLAAVWPHVYVEEANLSVNVASLRKVLDEGDKRRYIQTVPKRGYRFVADAHARGPLQETVIGSEPLLNGERLNSVAVLPFENEGGGPLGEYLAAGLMESVTNNLSQSPDLRVMARHTIYSHHRCNIDPRSIGEKLGVHSILLGRILPLDDRLIVRAELVDVRNGWQLWGEQYHARISDVLAIQQELTVKIVEGLRRRLKIAICETVSIFQNNPTAFSNVSNARGTLMEKGFKSNFHVSNASER